MKTILFSIGVSHRNTPLELRERLSQPPERVVELLKAFHEQAAASNSPIRELAILSTCNRLEIHASAVQEKAAGAEGGQLLHSLLEQVCQASGIAASKVEPFLFYQQGLESILRLCRVAAGLDSMLVGEPQILGQVAQAHELALSAGSAGPILSPLFRAAIHAGKRVRTETSISRQSSSVGSASVHLAEAAIGSLAERSILVIGSGTMGKLVVETLHKRGARRVTVISRTFEHAQTLAMYPGVMPQPYDQLDRLVAEAEVVFSAVSAPQPILGREQMRLATDQRPNSPLVLVDLAVPRNIDLAVRTLPNLRLFDIDDLRSQVDQSAERLRQELPKAEAIVLEEAQAFDKWLAVMPIVRELHKQAEGIRQREVERMRQRLPDLDPQVEASLELFSQALVKKLLHNPTMRLRKDSGPRLKDYSETLAVLFDLPLEEIQPVEGGRKDGWEL